MKKALTVIALAFGGSLLLAQPAANADGMCAEGDQLSQVTGPGFLAKKDRDGDGVYCVHVTIKRNGDQQLRYYDDI